MKVPINQNSISFDDLKAKVTSAFPNYKVNVRAKNFLIVAKTGTCGVNVILKKEKIFVVGNFPTMFGQMLFMVSVILLGIIIPLIVYYAAFNGKMKQLEKEVAGYLQSEVGKKM